MDNITENTTQTKGQPKHWFHHPDIAENLVSIPSNKIFITYNTHIHAETHLKLGKDKKNTVAVKPMGNGYFKLVAGLNSYVRAKALNLSVDAFITSCGRKEFVKKYKLGK